MREGEQGVYEKFFIGFDPNWILGEFRIPFQLAGDEMDEAV